MVATQAKKRILILAGPNGAGKTTFAREFLPDEAQCPTFVNADLIAAGLSPFNPETAAMRAGRLMVQLIAEHVARGDSFAFETTRTLRPSTSLWSTLGRSTTTPTANPFC